MIKPGDIPQQPQRQDSLADQLCDLIVWANRLGLYDAADHLAERGSSDVFHYPGTNKKSHLRTECKTRGCS